MPFKVVVFFKFFTFPHSCFSVNLETIKSPKKNEGAIIFGLHGYDYPKKNNEIPLFWIEHVYGHRKCFLVYRTCLRPHDRPQATIQSPNKKKMFLNLKSVI